MNPCIGLTFNGQCEAVFRFYESCLGGKIVFALTWRDSPMGTDAPPEWGGKILHATLNISDCILAGYDALPGQYQQPRGFSVMLNTRNPEDAERAFHALAENGTVQLPIQETFWAALFGMVTDRFGIPWSINCERSE